MHTKQHHHAAKRRLPSRVVLRAETTVHTPSIKPAPTPQTSLQRANPRAKSRLTRTKVNEPIEAPERARQSAPDSRQKEREVRSPHTATPAACGRLRNAALWLARTAPSWQAAKAMAGYACSAESTSPPSAMLPPSSGEDASERPLRPSLSLALMRGSVVLF